MYQPSRRPGPVFFIFAFLISMYFFWTAGLSWKTDSYNLAAGEASMKWPTATGRIVSSNISSQYVRQRYNSYYEYKCQVQYEYAVKGKRYAGNRITFGGDADHPLRDKDRASFIVDHFRPGSKVPVRYNPSLHGESVLFPGVDADRADFGFWRFAWFGLGTLLLMLLGAFSNNEEQVDPMQWILLFSALALGALICFNMQPAFIRHLVAPNAIVQQFR